MGSTTGDAWASVEAVRRVEPSSESIARARTSGDDLAGHSPTLLQSKIALPRHIASAPLLERTQLLARIRDASNARLILVCAPAGYGKTVLAAQVASAQGGAWLSLDQRDNDPTRFIAYFSGALEKVGIASARRLRLVGENMPWTALEQTLNEFSPETETVTLVIDGYHRIENPDVHQLLRYIVEFMPPELRLLVTSRTLPPIPLARLRASEVLLELTVDDLRFSQDEAARYLGMDDERRLPLSAVVRAHERTEGWIVALQLLKTLLHEQSDERRQQILDEFGGTNRHIADFMIDEVLSQRAESRDFLILTSILSRLTGPLCDAVTGQANGVATLQELEQAGSLLFALDDERRWYRYHHFLAQLLQRQLADTLDPHQIAVLHGRASEWLSTNGFPEEAIEHAIAACDWALAVELMTHLGLESIAYRDTLKLRRWLESLPVEMRDADPALAFWYGRALSSTCQPQVGRAFLERAEAYLIGDGSQQMLGSVRMGRAWNAIDEGRYADALELARSSVTLSTDDPAEAQAMALYSLGVAQVRLGQVRQGLASMTEAVAIHPLPLITALEIGHARALSGELAEAERDILRGLSNWNPTEAHRRGHVWLAGIYLAWNDLERAADHVARATELTEMLEARTNLPSLEIAQARLLWAQGEQTAALALLTAACSQASGSASDAALRAIACVRAGFWLELGQLGNVGAWCYQAGLDPEVHPDYRRQEELLVYARFLVATGSSGVALDLLGHLRRLAEKDGRVLDTARILLANARTHLARNQPDEAQADLLRAIALLEPSGHIRAFADEGAALLGPLGAIAALGHHLDYVGQLLQTINPRLGLEGELESGWPESLTRRELEVLRLIAVGFTNREIAEQLFISVPTVKRHISTIFDKLDVVNRVQAVNLARSHQLI